MDKTALKIGIIQQAPDLGGAEQYMVSLMKEFKENNAEIYFATNNERFLDLVHTTPYKIKMIRFVLDIIGNYRGLIKSILFLPYAFYFYSKLLREFKKEKIDIILMSGFSEKMLVTFLSKFFNIPVVWIEYGPLKTIFRRNFFVPYILYRLLKNIPYTIIVPSQNTAYDLKTQGNVSRLTIIPCGVEIPRQNKIINPFPNWENNIIVGNISRLTKEKGQDYIIRSAPHIIQKNSLTRFVLVGDGPDKFYYESLINELHLNEYFLVTGYVDETVPYFEALDIFVFPTVWPLEGFGLVTIEAMMHRKPVVAFDTGPVKEIVSDPSTGILVPQKNTEKLADAISTLIGSPTKRKEMGENGYRKARKEYSIKTASKKVLAVLYDAVALK